MGRMRDVKDSKWVTAAYNAAAAAAAMHRLIAYRCVYIGLARW